MNNTDCLKQANRLGLFLVSLFIICFIWFYVRSVEPVLHAQLFKLTFFGHSGMNAVSFVTGAIQSYVWGYIFIGIWKGISSISGFKK